MEGIYYAFLFLFGIFVGSFLNVVADRSVSGESIWRGRSHCDFCKKILGIFDLIPLLSFITSRGKCRSCEAKLSFWYPISEIMTGLLFMLAYAAAGGFNVKFVFNLIVFCFFIVLFLTDAKYRLIPNVVVIPGIIFAFLFLTFIRVYAALSYYLQWLNDPIGNHLIQTGFWWDQVLFMFKGLGLQVFTALLIAGFFWILVWLTKGRGMGGGDITLGLLIGLFNEAKMNEFPMNVLAIFLGFLIGAVYALVLVVLRKKGMKDTLAFGPFLIIGSVVALVFGRLISDWYLGIL